MKIDFRGDIINYFLSILIPGAVNFFSIPLIKWLIGTEKYGEYAIWYGAFLIIVSTSSGWFFISIIRFRPEFARVDFFYKHIYRIAINIGCLICTFFFVAILFSTGKMMFAGIFSIALFGCILQNTIMAISQANFLSRYVVYSESIRTISFVAGCAILLGLGAGHPLEKIFSALLVSYILSIMFLKKKNKMHLTQFLSAGRSSESFPYKSFFHFGVPLMLWYLVAGIIPYCDKLLIAKTFGYRVQGNYQAIFDLVYRAVGITVSPLLAASFPYLTKIYMAGDLKKVINVVNKLILMEIGIMSAILIIYYAGAANILQVLLNLPSDKTYVHVGGIIILVAFVWQMALLMHKPFEMMKKTRIILLNNVIALLATLLVISLLYSSKASITYYPLGIFAGAVCYMVLCFCQLRAFIRKDKFMQK